MTRPAWPPIVFAVTAGPVFGLGVCLAAYGLFHAFKFVCEVGGLTW